MISYAVVSIFITLYSDTGNRFRLIPAGDAPEQWGDNYLECARVRVMEARRGIVERDPNAEAGGWKQSCAIM
jgi:hypothetical protein